MLQSLSIKNVALIKEIEIDFGKGFNVLVGETGAGKSIIFDSLNFVLGSKADKTLIRYGENFMKVDAVFAGIAENVKKFLAENDLSEDEGEVMLSRTLFEDMKNVCKINGKSVSLGVLKTVGQMLVDSYSQHESISLLKSKNHLSLLDKFGGDEISSLKEKVCERFSKVQEIKKQIADLGGDKFERERTKELLSYQIEELEKAQLQVGEEEELKNKLDMFSSAEKINEALSGCEESLEDSSSSVIDQIQQCEAMLSSLSSFENINNCRERLTSARYEIEDISQTLKEIKNELSFDEREFERLDRRYDLVKSLIKKYGGSCEKAIEYLSQIKERINALEDADFLIDKYEKQLEKEEEELSSLAEMLTTKRKQVALDIESRIVGQLRELGMKSTIFKTVFVDVAMTANGKDEVEFTFSANKGQDAKSLSKTASGGELSRFMLAIKNIFSQIDKTGTLIFDEIDSGISGETGVIVGQKIKNLTKNSQVICITHLPQVAAFGDNFFYVSKKEDDKTTYTQVKDLKGEEVVYEIARMIGGDKISQVALKHAQEMIDQTKTRA